MTNASYLLTIYYNVFQGRLNSLIFKRLIPSVVIIPWRNKLFLLSIQIKFYTLSVALSIIVIAQKIKNNYIVFL